MTPLVWYRYVDDTFTVLLQNQIEEFTDFLNSQNQSIQFTIGEEECKLAFLDTHVERKEDGSLKVCVYRKPTHTDQYLNWESNHHMEHKRSVIHTLLSRAAHLVTEELEADRQAEVCHVKKVLKVNGYKPWAFKLPSKKKQEDPPETVDGDHGAPRKFPVKIPYVKAHQSRSRGFSKNMV